MNKEKLQTSKTASTEPFQAPHVVAIHQLENVCLKSEYQASTEGLLIYSLDTLPLFDPIDLDLAVTPASTIHVLEKEKDYLKALVMAFRLNEAPLIRQVFEAVPHTSIELTVAELPINGQKSIASEAHVENAMDEDEDGEGEWIGLD
ncbi:putative Periodic tryptophan protein 2 like protein [Glarea lozoyensis 74030]|uniref:Putative Periodic tryptophan protein 2 like protein n=1 Tax=Glarea lozoyensis (strain ATCC 74030 / MF5533) TaxID=1104152 RepID=H0EU78_GLAL7|nr:putative Periodic tryptophan protein 2 like protein [Glarea lozoyensis 74030]